ncbi:unnamed protein product [Bursaphelenchus xylophilus]|uniref:(pine wood nematode) hypothetical protein n=1 Tax=Bursaphelenchus xylophilus TaxID=6326 RepID=A0A1I7SRI9_BURXY|nr:unnamed protein product [Bursaphelenchus xylophilus]CAG9102311.1 unnamed protein product [Bursaphelenchus xylophilus]
MPPKPVKVQTFASPKQALIIGCCHYLVWELFTDFKTLGVLLSFALITSKPDGAYYSPRFFQFIAIYITLGHILTQLDAVLRCKEIYEKAAASKEGTADQIIEQLTLYLPTDRYHMAARVLHSFGINLSRPIIKELKAIIDIKVAAACFTACALNILLLLTIVFTSYIVFAEEFKETESRNKANELIRDNMTLKFNQ